jgi:hypothetical protein
MKHILQIPQRITTLLAHNNSRVLKIILMTLVFITAVYTKEYRGEYQTIINNNIGGILYVLFGSLAFSLFLQRQRPWWPVLMAFAGTCILEIFQYFKFPYIISLTQHKAFAFLFGLNYDPRDFIYYAIGGVISILLLFAIERLPADSAEERRF